MPSTAESSAAQSPHVRSHCPAWWPPTPTPSEELVEPSHAAQKSPSQDEEPEEMSRSQVPASILLSEKCERDDGELEVAAPTRDEEETLGRKRVGAGGVALS